MNIPEGMTIYDFEDNAIEAKIKAVQQLIAIKQLEKECYRLARENIDFDPAKVSIMERKINNAKIKTYSGLEIDISIEIEALQEAIEALQQPGYTLKNTDEIKAWLD